MSESFPHTETLTNPEIVTQADLKEAAPGTTLSVIVSDLFGSNGGAVEGLHELRFTKLGSDDPESWKGGPGKQGWFQHLPGYGHRPAHINGSRRTYGEIVKGETFDFVAYDTVDPRNQDEIDRLIAAGAMILETAPEPGSEAYEHLLREGLFATTDPEGNFHWRISQEHVQGKVESMQVELPAS